MPDDRSFIRVDLDVSLGSDRAAAHRPETSFRIAILGDFSGRGSRGITETGRTIAGRHPMLIDRDNFDEALGRFAPELHLSAAADIQSPVRLRFTELEDFHPDRLFERLPVFQALRQMRARLANPATSAEAARELQGLSDPALAPPTEPTAPAPPHHAVPANLLEQMLEETEDAVPTRTAQAAGDLHTFLKRIVTPHLVPGIDPRQSELMSQLDAAATAYMRAVLHHPDFQALEALWRAVFFLLRRVETTPELQIYLVDLSKAELLMDLAPDRPLQDAAMYDLLVESSVGTPGGATWSLLVGAYTFGNGPDDVSGLGRLATLASMAGAPWISGAHPRLAGWESFETTPDPLDRAQESDPGWEALRRAPHSSYLGLALPRLLLRLPYGEDTEPCELFRFEEMGAPPAHGDYLWGNPAIACALLLAESFTSSGWALRPGSHLDIENLPLHLVRAHGEVTAKPCAEALLTDRVVAYILERGLMPLVSVKNSDAVRLVRFQSVTHPLSALAGRWGGANADGIQ